MITFTDALKSADLSAIRSFSKADLHNYFVLGGNRKKPDMKSTRFQSS